VLRVSYEAVLNMVSVTELVGDVRSALISGVVCPPRDHHELGSANGDGAFLIMPAWRPGGAVGVKIVTAFPHNHDRGRPFIQGEFLLFDGETGEPIASIDGRALTLLRTAAVSAVAADLLAPPNAKTLLMIGTGALAPHLIAGHRSVREYDEVVVWGRDAAKAAGLVQQLRRSGIEAKATNDVQRAAGQADVICCATSTQNPVVRGAWLKPRAHLDLVGSFQPWMRESDDDCVREAMVVTDTLGAVTESGDLRDPIESGVLSSNRILLLEDMLRRGPLVQDRGVSVFKSVGVATSDLATAEHIHARAMGTSPRSGCMVAASGS
jgi:alanine dehydrogenase